MAPALRLPSLKVSDWHIVNDDSLTVSAGTPVVELDVAAGYFTMMLANTRTSQVLTLNGFGAGEGVGVGLLPADISGDPQAAVSLLPNSPFGSLKKTLMRALAASSQLPGWNSPIFLFPGRTDSQQLFSGWAQIISASAGDGVEIGAGIVVFFDVTATADFEIALAETVNPIAAAAVFAITSVKAFAFVSGLDYISDASIGVGDIIYKVQSYPSNACFASPG